MTVSTTDRKATFNGNDSATSFPFTNFKVPSNTELQVIHTSSTGLETVLVEGTDYSVSLNADQEANPGGTVTYPLSGSPLPTGEKLTIARVTDNTQPVKLVNQGAWQPEVVEGALDDLTMQVQDLKEQIDRSVKVDISDSTTPDQLLDSIEQSEANAAASASAAATSESNAATSESNAANSAAAAAADADRAEQAASNANHQFAPSIGNVFLDNWPVFITDGYIPATGGPHYVAAATVQVPVEFGNYRTDRIVLNMMTGAVELVSGTPSATAPAPVPAVPLGRRAICRIELDPQESGNPATLVDERVLQPSNNTIVGCSLVNSDLVSVANNTVTIMALSNMTSLWQTDPNMYDTGASVITLPSASVLRNARLRIGIKAVSPGAASVAGKLDLRVRRNYSYLNYNFAQTRQFIDSNSANDADIEASIVTHLLTNNPSGNVVFDLTLLQNLGESRDFYVTHFSMELFA